MSEQFDQETILAGLSDKALKTSYQEAKAREARTLAIYRKIAGERGLDLDAKE